MQLHCMALFVKSRTDSPIYQNQYQYQYQWYTSTNTSTTQTKCFTSHSAMWIENISPTVQQYKVVVILCSSTSNTSTTKYQHQYQQFQSSTHCSGYEGLQKWKSDNARITTSVLLAKSRSLRAMMMMKKLAKLRCAISL